MHRKKLKQCYPLNLLITVCRFFLVLSVNPLTSNCYLSVMSMSVCVTALGSCPFPTVELLHPLAAATSATMTPGAPGRDGVRLSARHTPDNWISDFCTSLRVIYN